ncbi:tetratricopeptide repeat-containing sulfotransferase family protein [Phenylobacterium sp.]|uniref:tetratricopeptide repeat-containing sulfotransferase family protein n=1 Tax=Phenylobacterium sp. TaxID=1871053 RepID=UPI002DF27D94|nr:sulfotransferase [Phenylobacterium sp.]
MSDASDVAAVSVDQIYAAVEARDMDRAIRLAAQAHAAGSQAPLVLNLVAYQLELDDRIDEALEVLNQALKVSPGDPTIINSIGVCYSKLARPQNALAAFDDALLLNPDFPHAHNGRGLALQSLGDKDGAKLAQLRAAELDPQFPEPLGALAALAAEDKEWDAARDYAERALALEADQPAGAMALAAVELNAGDPTACETRLTKLIAAGRLTRLHLANALNLRGDAREALGRAPEAMADYAAANRELRPRQVDAQVGRELGLDTCNRLLAYFEKADPGPWKDPVPESQPTDREMGHVFLVGFARSGTTLLEQILASHADIVALEEKPAVDPPIIEFLMNDADIDRLAHLDEAGALHWRKLYWARVREFGVEPAGKVFVDKLPLHTIYLPVIAKLFPRAKILFARRDPRDVVISCFKHRFRANPLTVEFTDLERTAQVYDRFMRLAEIYRAKLPLQVHVHKHEDLVEDLDTQTQAICAFIGLPWDANMRNFVETANRRNIRTPSAGQVRRGLYREGLAAWRKYGDTIEVIKPILAPWAETYGYPKD